MLMTPGPTAVPPAVREAMGDELVNPDVDPAFAAQYDAVCAKLAEVQDTDHDVVVLGGEGILGLEAAVTSLVAPGDRVCCLANGLYGAGFADFVENVGGKPTLVAAGDRAGLPLDELEATLAGSEFDVATMVHCETPTGTLNDLEPALDLFADHGVLTIVDAVSSLGGTPIPDGIDVCLGGSQKCFSAPPGLTTVGVSDAAWEKAEAVAPDTLYTNLLPWRDTSEGFPYTHLSANVAGLDAALDLLLEEGLDSVYARHEEAAAHCRERGADLGLELYPDAECASPTVSAFYVPDRAADLQQTLHEDHGITLATGLADHADNILRVGHMGYNAEVSKVDQVMDALANEV
jgi:aspartate aminotransferase-like enzyme